MKISNGGACCYPWTRYHLLVLAQLQPVLKQGQVRKQKDEMVPKTAPLNSVINTFQNDSDVLWPRCQKHRRRSGKEKKKRGKAQRRVTHFTAKCVNEWAYWSDTHTHTHTHTRLDLQCARPDGTISVPANC